MRERSKRPNRQYAAIPNAAMRDERISIEARGLLALLMTHSDSFNFRRDHLMKTSGMKKDKFTRVMGELLEFGYAEVVVVRNKMGHLLGKTWVIHDEPTEVGENRTSDNTEVRLNRSLAEPKSGKSAPIRKQTLKENQKEEPPKPPEGADDLFSELENSDQSIDPNQSSEADEIQEGFQQFWDEIWPNHKRKSGKMDCQKIYTAACLGKHSKAEKISPQQLNRCAAAYIASVTDQQFLKGPLPWLRLPGWEPFMADAEEFNIEDLRDQQRRMLEDGRVPPSMMEDGQPNAAAQFWLKKFGFGRAA